MLNQLHEHEKASIQIPGITTGAAVYDDDEDDVGVYESDESDEEETVEPARIEGGVYDEGGEEEGEEEGVSLFNVKLGGKRRKQHRRRREDDIHKDSRRTQTTPKKNRKKADAEDAAADGKDAADQRPEDPKLAAKWELDRLMDAAVKGPKKKRKVMDEDDLEQMADEQISHLRQEMRDAAIRDAQANSQTIPATQKLKLLPKVDAILQKTSLYDSILENNLLETIRIWLEPLPDRSLPSFSIQRLLFAALQRLPIRTQHLRESGIGKVVNFYTKSTKPEDAIKRQANQLIRMFFNLLVVST